jgi:hypothetical protein
MQLTACVASPANGKANIETPPFALEGDWELKSILPVGEVQGPGIQQQKQLLGTLVGYHDNELTACRAAVPITSIEKTRMTPADFLAGNHVSFDQLGIRQKTITQIVINDRQSGSCFGDFPLPGQVVYLLSEKDAVILFEGVFYQAKRVARGGGN